MTIELAIQPDAEREWARLDESVIRRFTQKLARERLIRPRVAKNALHGPPDFYRAQIAAPQYRLACQVNDTERRLTIVAVRSRDDVYALLAQRA